MSPPVPAKHELVEVALQLGFPQAVEHAFRPPLQIGELAVTIASFGVVLFVLSALSILPKVTVREGLAKANAAIEVPRAIASFVVPLLIGLYFTAVPPVLIIAIAMIGSLVALGFTSTLSVVEMEPPANSRVFKRIVEGGAFVLRHRLLLPISLCAIFWNLAFAALLVVLVPVFRQIYRIDPGAFGIGLSFFGLAMILGTWVIGRFADRIALNLIQLFGPGSSFLAALGMALIPSGGSGAFITPWDWRKRDQQTQILGALTVPLDAQRKLVPQPFKSASPSTGCQIKGNISSKGVRIYHALGQKHYEKTRITESKGERWFCTEGEAQADGWRRARN